MSIDTDALARLQFLGRVVRKESQHLQGTDKRLFAEPFTAERAAQLEHDALLSERVEAFASRFARLQDTVGDKLIPSLLRALGERPGVAIDNLDLAERFGWLASVDDWLAARQLRNRMVHEYVEQADLLANALTAGHAFVPLLTDTATRLNTELVKRGWA